MVRLLATLLLLVSVSGCGIYSTFELPKFPSPDPTPVVVDTGVQKNIKLALADASKEDCATIYKFFAGMSLYLNKTDKITTTTQVVKLFSEVEKEYEWPKKKYPDLTVAINTDLRNQGYHQPKQLTDEIRKDLVDRFNQYAQACKQVYLSK